MTGISTPTPLQNIDHPPVRSRESLIWLVLLVLVLAAGIYFRFTGLFWGEFSHLHPDERFLIQVTSHITAVDSLSEYFNTAKSTLNPHNVGDTLFVYGTFPIIATRYLADSIFGNVFWEQISMTGRTLSAVMDMVTVFLVYLLGARLFNRKVGVLGAAFSAFAVMQIQQAHFFTVDSFSTTFTTLALYFAARLATLPIISPAVSGGKWYKSESLINSLWFGVAIGAAMACKINTALMVFLLPAAWFIFIMRHPRHQRLDLYSLAVRDLILGGIGAFLIFRVFQPYAFEGPGFLGIIPNDKWIMNLRELSNQMSGDVDFPPALQWARRSVTFSFTNMVVWGMGLPMGILAWAGFLWMGFKQLNGTWKRSLLVWGWTAVYFIWQSMQGNPTMRYQLPIYPTLALIAGWSLVNLWELGKQQIKSGKTNSGTWIKAASVLVGIVTLTGTFAWAFAFTQMYTRPMTRVEASRWLLDTVPGPVNLNMVTESGNQTQLLPYNPMLVLSSNETVALGFVAKQDGQLTDFQFTTIQDLNQTPEPKTLIVTVFDADDPEKLAGYGFLEDSFTFNDGSLLRWNVTMEMPVSVQTGHTYQVKLNFEGPITGLGFSGATGATIRTASGITQQEMPTMIDTVRYDSTREIRFMALYNGQLNQIVFPHVLDTRLTEGQETLRLSIGHDFSPSLALAETTIVRDFSSVSDYRGDELVWKLTAPVHLIEGEIYSLRMELVDGDGALGVYGSTIAVETTWDDGLPIRIGSYDPYGGIYVGDLNFEMYWDDNAEKLTRFKSVLNRSDYLTISSNRQWGTTTRVPERYPLTTEFYRALIGCPDAENILTCYRTAEVGSYVGDLGFELVKVYVSDPSLGGFRINDQYAEEAFTVYDHPKVFIFRKVADYSSEKVAGILDAVDVSNVVHVTPGKAPSYPANLMLPKENISRQENGGTWSRIFNTDAIVNQLPGFGAVIWVIFIFLIGVLVYPILRIAMRGAPDFGYPLAKIFGLTLLTWLVWTAGSHGVTFSKGLIIGCIVIIGLIGAAIVAWQPKMFWSDLKNHWRYFLLIEAVGLAFFLVFLLIRLGNPDLWHPNFGGEKPMDFAYFNAVIKSSTFPPYNPWYAGSWINYYYYGFVIAAVPTKLLGIMPSVAYNLILPTFFSMTALGAFSIGWNLQQWFRNQVEDEEISARIVSPPWIAGLGSAIAMVVLGNLGTVRMMWQGVMKLAAPGGVIENTGIISKIGWTFSGLIKYFAGAALPYYPGDYYWIPSRAIKGGDAITEFPFFTFLYGDPHAHMFALPITLLVLAWVLSLVLMVGQVRITKRIEDWLPVILTLFFGGLVIGSLRPTNTWDLPTYLGLAIVGVLFSFARTVTWPEKFLFFIPQKYKNAVMAIAAAIVLVALSFLLYQPYQHWYAQGYSKIELWWGERTSFPDFLTHWGLFLVIILTWFVHESIDWMDKTPVSKLNYLRPYKPVIIAALILFGVVVLFLTFQQKAPTAWLTSLLAVWSLLLILRPGQPQPKRAVLFMVGTAAVLTLMVEIIVLLGDINRMNTVFKFYLQSWTLFSLSAAAALFWLLPTIEARWKPVWRNTWIILVGLMVVGALFYPLTAASAKMRDRISTDAPHTLDGMAFMQTAEYFDQSGKIDLNSDYKAIRWLQENVVGSPVIVEANTTEYRWGSRFSIYTGLPTTIGWNWHQRQQRATIPDTSIWLRINDVAEFYNTTDLQETISFVEKYNVKYIMVGELERNNYDPFGISKFAQYDGQYWREVYLDELTAIYEVMN